MNPQEMQKKYNSPLQHQLYELLMCLHQLGRDFPQILIHISEIVDPDLAADKRITVLGKMFEELPGYIIQQNPQQLQKLLLDPPLEMQTLRLLLGYRELQQLLQQMSYLQLLHLSNNIIPPGPLNLQFDFLKKVQEIFQTWSQQTISNHHQTLADTPLHMERQQLLQLEPNIPWELLHFLIELLKLPLEEIFSMQEWISKLPTNQLQIIVQTIQMEPAAILEVKRRMDLLPYIPLRSQSLSNGDITMDSSDGFGSPSSPSSPIFGAPLVPQQLAQPQSRSLAYSTDQAFQLRIARQPPTRTVYQRILKPFPSVMLAGGNFDATLMSNLFVEATLLRTDSDIEIPTVLEGNKVVRISNGAFATFKKLKILSTSQQQGTLFRLKFSLKKYVGNIFEPIPNATIISNPIEVFSHTLYINQQSEVPPPPPVVHEILPSSARIGSRAVVLGSNFVQSSSLKVRFGDAECVPIFHEQGTLICVIPNPQRLITGPVPVTVTNDGANYCETKTYFTFYNG